MIDPLSFLAGILFSHLASLAFVGLLFWKESRDARSD